jgi:hypothetical protein
MPGRFCLGIFLLQSAITNEKALFLNRRGHELFKDVSSVIGQAASRAASFKVRAKSLAATTRDGAAAVLAGPFISKITHLPSITFNCKVALRPIMSLKWYMLADPEIQSSNLEATQCRIAAPSCAN